MSRRARKGEAHVRLYRHELESPAYRTLSPEARALLVELRALFRPGSNRVFISRRQIETRLGVGRVRAENARDELLDRGWVELVEPASFNRKVRHAPVYALTNEVPDPTKEGAVPKKSYMKWRPPRKSTGSKSSPDGVDEQPRTSRSRSKIKPHEAGERPRGHGCVDADEDADRPTDKLPGGIGLSGPRDLILAALTVRDDRIQYRVCLLALLARISAGARS